MKDRAILFFFLRTLAWFVGLLVWWYLLRALFVAPLAWLSEGVARLLMPDWIRSFVVDDVTLSLGTTIQAPHPSGRLVELGVRANLLNYCYGTPLLAALLLSSRTPGWVWKLPLLLVALLPFQAWGVFFGVLSQIATLSSVAVPGQVSMSPLQTNLIVLASQFGLLVLPALAPIAMWVATNRDFVRELVRARSGSGPI